MSLFGRSKQFHRSLEASWPRLYRVAYSWTHDACLAHDLVQETISRALQHKDKITDHKALEIWLFKVMVNYWRDLLRRRKDLAQIEEDQLVDDRSPDSDTDRVHLISQVRNAITRLNQDQRQIITLIAIQGFSYAEVAGILDIPIGTVMSRICRARQNLKRFLTDTDINIRQSDRVWRLK